MQCPSEPPRLYFRWDPWNSGTCSWGSCPTCVFHLPQHLRHREPLPRTRNWEWGIYAATTLTAYPPCQWCIHGNGTTTIRPPDWGNRSNVQRDAAEWTRPDSQWEDGQSAGCDRGGPSADGVVGMDPYIRCYKVIRQIVLFESGKDLLSTVYFER